MVQNNPIQSAEEAKSTMTLPYNPVIRESQIGTKISAPPPTSSNINFRVPPGLDSQAVPKYRKGGLADGGMLQEGGTVDPVSGNEVPTGSLKEEVRDDIPAQLSEGEFVFPADVVRYIGLEKLMQLRQAAKEGLAKMEAMGQMGNSEEATMEDTGEFESEIDDILKEVESEEEES
jgi:Arc/MetJ-type ribon-helix-helix transcriptional regulator